MALERLCNDVYILEKILRVHFRMVDFEVFMMFR